MSDHTATQKPTIPLSLPAGYDLGVGQTCSFLVNVAVDMATQWKAQGQPPPSGFSWTPTDRCAYTSGFSISSFTFGDIIWSTFSVGGTTYTEPFGFMASNASTASAYLAFRGSQTTADGEMDAEWAQVPYTSPLGNPPPGMKVEEGFYGGVQWPAGVLDESAPEGPALPPVHHRP